MQDLYPILILFAGWMAVDLLREQGKPCSLFVVRPAWAHSNG